MALTAKDYVESSQQKIRVGLIVPSVQSVTEPLFNRLCGNRFDFLAHRMRLQGGRVEDLIAMEARLPEAVCTLRDAGVSLLAYCCTGSGAIQGREREEELCRTVERQTGIPMITTMLSCVDALKSAKAKKLVVVMPNAKEVAAVELNYLARDGFQILSFYGFGLVDGRQFPDVSPAEIQQKTLESWNADADAVFLSCMNWHASETVIELQAKIGKPVITSHLATLWSSYIKLQEEMQYTDFLDKIQVKNLMDERR